MTNVPEILIELREAAREWWRTLSPESKENWHIIVRGCREEHLRFQDLPDELAEQFVMLAALSLAELWTGDAAAGN